jgi:hypothetical protein
MTETITGTRGGWPLTIRYDAARAILQINWLKPEPACQTLADVTSERYAALRPLLLRKFDGTVRIENASGARTLQQGPSDLAVGYGWQDMGGKSGG